MTLQAQGYRFTFRAGVYTWTHAAEVTGGHIDCTDMDDQQFEAFVLSVGAA